MQYPKVLIIGQTFNDYTGGGITLSNLFHAWPKDRIAVLANNNIYILSNTVCENNRGLNRYKWPICLFMNRQVRVAPSDTKLRPSNPYVNRFSLLTKMGIIPMLHSSYLDKQTISWIRSFGPDVIYTQLADYSLMKIVQKVKQLTGKPLAIHFMDDWPNDIYSGPLLNQYYRRRAIICLKRLISISSSVLCICEMMAKEYSTRYDRECHFLYNTPIIQLSTGNKRTLTVKKKNIGYFGRIGKGNYKTMVNFLNVLTHQEDIKLTLFSPDYKVFEDYNKYPNISINPATLSRDEVVKIYQDMDLLYLSIDFDAESVKFLRLSFATKVFDYLSASVPVLLQAPRGTAMAEFFIQNKCGFVLSESSPTCIESFISNFYKGQYDEVSVLQNAEKTFNTFANFEKNREKFMNILRTI